MAIKSNLVHKVVTHSETKQSGVVADSRHNDSEVRVKWSEGSTVSPWLNARNFEIKQY